MAEIVAEVKGWDTERKDSEIQKYKDYVQESIATPQNNDSRL